MDLKATRETLNKTRAVVQDAVDHGTVKGTESEDMLKLCGLAEELLSILEDIAIEKDGNKEIADEQKDAVALGASGMAKCPTVDTSGGSSEAVVTNTNEEVDSGKTGESGEQSDATSGAESEVPQGTGGEAGDMAEGSEVHGGGPETLISKKD